MNHRLTDVEDVHTTLGQDAGDGRSKTRTVFTCDVNQNDFAQNGLRLVEKSTFYRFSLTIGRSRCFAGP
ncbi:hypothetical protein D9M71_397760 [compost metagenome]